MKRKCLQFLSLAVLLALSTAAFAGGGTLAELLVREAALSEVLAKQLVKPELVTDRQAVVKFALLGLFGDKGKAPDAAQLVSLIRSLKTDGTLKLSESYGSKTETEIQKSLLVLLNTPEKDINQTTLQAAIDNLSILASVRGPFNHLIQYDCSRCGTKMLEQLGARAGLRAANASDILIPSDPALVSASIAAKCKNSGLCDGKTAAQSVGLENQRDLLTLLIKAGDKGSPEAEFADALSKLTGKNILADNNTIYKVLVEEGMNPELVASWTKILRRADQIRKKEGLSAKDAWYKAVDEQATTPEAKELAKELRAKDCYWGGRG